MLEDSHGDVDSATMEKGMGVIISETDRLSVMVEELLDFSRIQSGRMVLQPVKLDIIAELSEKIDLGRKYEDHNKRKQSF